MISSTQVAVLQWTYKYMRLVNCEVCCLLYSEFSGQHLNASDKVQMVTFFCTAKFCRKSTLATFYKYVLHVVENTWYLKFIINKTLYN